MATLPTISKWKRRSIEDRKENSDRNDIRQNLYKFKLFFIYVLLADKDNSVFYQEQQKWNRWHNNNDNTGKIAKKTKKRTERHQTKITVIGIENII